MKTNFLKFKLLHLMLFVLGIFMFAACDKNNDSTPDDIKSKIVGTWDFTSFKVGGTEYMGLFVDSAYIRFEALQGDEGDFEQSIAYIDDETVTMEGHYELDEAKQEVKLTAFGETEVVKITQLSGTNMSWSSTQDGKPVVAKTERRN